jgi:transposase-like protein
MADVLSHKRFHDEAEAYKWVEAHLWPHGPVCPKCGVTDDRVTKLQGKSTRIGVYKCKDCRKPFTVKVGTIFEDSHIPLRMWLQAIALLAASKKGISSNQLHRMLGITLKSAWFMSHRIREAMRSGGLAPPMGSSGSGTVEFYETFLGRKVDMKKNKGYAHKHAILSLVERGGEVRSFHIDNATAKVIAPIVNANVTKEAKLMTDDAAYYRNQFLEFASHETVRHTLGEYVVGQVHSNTVEGYFSIFKRGMKGVYQITAQRSICIGISLSSIFGIMHASR